MPDDGPGYGARMGSGQAIGHEAFIDVGAPSEAVWALVSDVTRTPEWSPVVRRSEWLSEPAGPVVGARFRGHNRFNGFRWSRECVVTEVEHCRAFAFETLGGDQTQTRWRYQLDPDSAGTRVTLAYEVVSMPRWVRLLRRLPGGASTNERQAHWNIEESLRRLRALAESGS
jgi:uncharacterized membrane protein